MELGNGAWAQTTGMMELSGRELNMMISFVFSTQYKRVTVVRPAPSPGGVQWRCLYIYIYHTLLCGQCRAACQQRHRYLCRLVSQSVGGLQSTAAVVAELGRALVAGRYVAVANKVLIL